MRMRLAAVCALCAFAASADELKVGGEIGRHLDLTVRKVLRHTDVEKDFLRFFRNRVPSEGRIRDCEQAGGPYGGFVVRFAK